MWYCPVCGTENHGTFCGACGTKKPKNAEQPQQQQQKNYQQQTEQPFEEPTPDTGYPTFTDASDTKPSPKKSNTGLLVTLICLCVALVIAIGVGIYILLTRDDDGGHITRVVVTASPKASMASTETPTPSPEATDVTESPAPSASARPTATPTPTSRPGKVVTATPTPSASTDSASKTSYLDKAEKIETECAERDSAATNQQEINAAAYANYEAWDALLNEVYQHLKASLSSSEFSKLKTVQLAWIKEKEDAIEEAVEDWGGGSGEAMIRYGTATTYTRERCYELIDMVK